MNLDGLFGLRIRWRPLFLSTLTAAFLFAACSGRHECNGPAGLCVEAGGGSAQTSPLPPASGAGGDDAAGSGETSGGMAGAPPSATGGAGRGGGSAPDLLGGSDGRAEGGHPPVLGAGAVGEAAAGEPGVGGQPTSDCEGGRSINPYLAISDVFVPAGYGELDWVELLDLAECPGRADGVLGACYGFEWTPYELAWVSVRWVYDEDYADGHDWWDGVCIQPGAIRLTFLARAEHAGQPVRFGVEQVGQDFVLSDSWEPYAIELSGMDYSHHLDIGGESRPGMQVGFWMELDQPERGIQRVFVDDIRLVGPTVSCTPPRGLPSVCEQGAVPVADPAADWCALRLDELPADPVAPTLLVDDLEDGDEWSLPLPGGRARWRIFNDATPGSAQYPDCPRPTEELIELDGGVTSERAMRTSGCGFRSWGAGIELSFRSGPPDCASPFDASGYDGIEFWIDILGSNETGPVTFQLNTTRTVPVGDGGNCTQGCYGNSFRDNPRSYTNGWTKVRIPFYELRQRAGPFSLLDPATILSLSWVTEGNAGPIPSDGSFSFDFAVDNVRFYREFSGNEPEPKP